MADAPKIQKSVELGPFEFADRLGAGATGAVYSGRHRPTETPVAVKVVRRPKDAEARESFHREVQAHAGLLHPGVVYLFEYGELDAAAERASDGILSEGDPFVVMEHADDGALRGEMPLESWASVRTVLRQILEALAHAHARDVVHRDLKPENLLLFESDEPSEEPPTVKLADFGIAHVFRREHETDRESLESAAGTPAYMAPEQLEGKWRKYGPWTDLYELGCIAWELVCGERPFDGETFFALALSHAGDERPPLEPQFPVPDGLEDWVHRAMAIEPRARFRRAADALEALPGRPVGATGGGEGPNAPVSDGSRRDDATSSADAAGDADTIDDRAATTLPIGDASEVVFAETLDSSDAPPSSDAPRSSDADASRPLEPGGSPQLSEKWRPDDTDPLPAPLVGAGLGLFGLREPPFVNRTDECDRLWQVLREVVDGEAPGVVFVEGEAGTGKSRLAEWMTTRAHEVGAVRTLRTIHSPRGGPGEGLSGVLARTLRTLKLQRGEVFEHLCETLPSLDDGDDDLRRRDARALTEYLRPTDDEAESVDGPRFRFASASQRHALVVRTLRRLSRERPLFVWFDDLQWAREALDVLEYLHREAAASPRALFLGTVRSDIVADRPRLQRRLDDLVAGSRAQSLQLEPLSRRHQRQLLVELLPLEEELADRLAGRTEGHPLFAMQLLGHWIETDALEVGSDGFGVAEGRELEVPEAIHELWDRRLRRLIEDLGPDAEERIWRVLERAAALGREVDDGEWRAVCRDAGLERPERLRRRLLDRGLARRSDRGWAFAHGLLVETLERRAKKAHRWSEHHGYCAELLERLYPGRSRRTAARRADHWEAAGRPERALAPLLQHARRLAALGRPEPTLDVLERRSELLREMDADPRDERRLENEIERAGVRLREGASPNEMLETLEKIRDRAASAGAHRLVARTWAISAWASRMVGSYERAARFARRAVDEAEATEDPEEIAEKLMELGATERYRGELDAAERSLRRAASHVDASNSTHRATELRREKAWLANARGETDLARQRFEQNLEAARRAGYRWLEADAANGLGELARFDGDDDRAREMYRRYRTICRELGRPSDRAISLLNESLVELDARRFDAAEQRLREARRRLESLDQKREFDDLLRLARLVHAAGTGDGSTFDRIARRYRDGWPADARLGRDHPWLLEMAADYAHGARESEQSRPLWRLAQRLWRRLGNEEGVERIEAKLED